MSSATLITGSTTAPDLSGYKIPWFNSREYAALTLGTAISLLSPELPRSTVKLLLSLIDFSRLQLSLAIGSKRLEKVEDLREKYAKAYDPPDRVSEDLLRSLPLKEQLRRIAMELSIAAVEAFRDFPDLMAWRDLGVVFGPAYNYPETDQGRVGPWFFVLRSVQRLPNDRLQWTDEMKELKQISDKYWDDYESSVITNVIEITRPYLQRHGTDYSHMPRPRQAVLGFYTLVQIAFKAVGYQEAPYQESAAKGPGEDTDASRTDSQIGSPLAIPSATISKIDVIADCEQSSITLRGKTYCVSLEQALFMKSLNDAPDWISSTEMAKKYPLLHSANCVLRIRDTLPLEIGDLVHGQRGKGYRLKRHLLKE